MIEARRLAKRFGAVQAVREVSFSAPDGRITGLLGPNGAGKSTSLRMVCTVMRPDAGEALIDGGDVAVDPLAARRRIGVLSHAAGLYPHLTGRENVLYFGELHGMARAERERRADELIEMLDMRDCASRRAKGFSQGQRLKTALARALVHAPRNLVLDEPTNGLDPQGTREVRHLVADLAADGATVFVSSHLLSEVEQICSHLGVMRTGRLVAQGPIGELSSLTATRFRVRTADVDQALAVLGGLGVTDAVRTAEGVTGSLGDLAPERIVRDLVEADVSVAEFVQVAPALEDLFVQLTGEGFDVSG